MDNRLILPSDYDKVTLLLYPRKVGGKFLNTCLGFSDQYVFQDIDLAKQQVNGNFELKDKIKYINKQLFISAKTKIWQDLFLGCDQLWGTNTGDQSCDELEKLKTEYFYYDDIFYLMKNNVWLSRVGHNIRIIKNWYKIFPNSTLIYYYNWDNFLFSRDKAIQKNWNIVKQSSWDNKHPYTIEEFYNLSSDVKKEIKKFFPSLYYQLLLIDNHKKENDIFVKELKESNNKVYYWDVDWYNDESVFLEKLKELYKKLNLEINWKDEQIVNYRKKWMYTIL